jgi:hypothetical protein
LGHGQYYQKPVTLKQLLAQAEPLSYDKRHKAECDREVFEVFAFAPSSIAL